MLKVLQLNEDILSETELARLLRYISFYHPELDTALYWAQRSLQIAKEINAPTLQGEALEEISYIERRLGNNNASLQATLEALAIYESLGLVERQAASYAQLAQDYMSNGDVQLSITYFKKAETAYRNSEEKVNHALAVLNLGEAYRLAQYPDSAETYFNQALRLNKTLENPTIQSYSLGNLGMVYAKTSRFQLAKEKLNQAISLLTMQGDRYSVSVYTAELGRIYQQEGNWELAEDKLKEALDMVTGEGLKEEIRDFSAMLVDLYEQQQRYSLALRYQKLFQVYQDSLVNKANIQKMEQLKSGYEIDKRESQIELLNQINDNQRHLAIGLAMGVVIFIGFTYLLYRSNKHIKKANALLSRQNRLIEKREEEKALLLRELNHRVKNNLQLISSLLSLQSHALTGNPAKEAIAACQYRVEALSLIHQRLYQEGLQTQVQANEYVKELVLNIFYSYNVHFQPEFDIDPINVDVDLAIPLGLIINELVTNSLKHAYRDIDQPVLKVLLKRQAEGLCLHIVDNGVGISMPPEKTSSFGIKLVNSLVKQLNGIIERGNNDGTDWKVQVRIA